jgi:hypothetical protein
MFGLFKKKNPMEELQKKYSKLMEEAHRLSTTDRTASDAKMAEAQEVLAEMEKIGQS